MQLVELKSDFFWQK